MAEPDAGALEGQVAAVTGASSGLGRATALALGQAGADVALLARSAEDLERHRSCPRPRGFRRAAGARPVARPQAGTDEPVWQPNTNLRTLDSLVLEFQPE